MTVRRKLTNPGVLLVLPSIFFVSLLIIFPLFSTLGLSFFSAKLQASGLSLEFQGLTNWIDVLQTSRLWNSLINTLTYTVYAISIQMLLGITLALLINKFEQLPRLRTLFLSPFFGVALAPVVVAMIWKFLYVDEYGIINYFLETMGISPPHWLADPSLALFSLVIIDTWMWTPFVLLFILSGLQAIPNAPQEAALVDGASRWQVFRYVTLPLLRPIILVLLLLRGADCLKVFDIIYVLTAGGPALSTETLSYFAYKLTFSYLDFGRGSVVSAIVLLFAGIVSLAFIRLIRLGEA